MPMFKRIVCLAISRKTGGLCVAGKELINGQPAGWIRPISDRKDEEVSIEECRYENGEHPELLHYRRAFNRAKAQKPPAGKLVAES